MDIPLIRRFELGYKEGAQKVNKDIKFVSNYVGVTGQAWNNPTKAKELALSQISKNADVIFHAAGGSGLGLFDAVEEVSRNGDKKVYAIGVDSNQNWMKPGYILTSMLKRVDVAVYETIKAGIEGTLQGGRKDFGLKNSGVGLAIDKHNKSLVSRAMMIELEKLRKSIMTSKIKVSDYYLIKK